MTTTTTTITRAYTSWTRLWGMVLQAVPQEGIGVIIGRIIPGQTAWTLGIRAGGRITHVNGNPLRGVFAVMRQQIRKVSDSSRGCTLIVEYTL